MSAFFSKINELLKIKHRCAATTVAKSNGLSENCVKRIIEHVKLYAEDDLDVERVLLLIAMNMRPTAHSRVVVSPFEIMFARQMRINAPVEPKMVLLFSGEKRRYYDCLAKEMKRLHQAVKMRKEEIKLQDKAAYDRANRVATPQWEIG